MGKRISELAALASNDGTELLLVSRLSPTIAMDVITIAFNAGDQSLNDSASGFVTAGFAAGQQVNIFSASGSNNHDSANIVSVTANKMVVEVAGGGAIVTTPTGITTRVKVWESMRTTVGKVAGETLTTLAIASGTVDIDTKLGDYFQLTLSANVGTLNLTVPSTAQVCSVMVEIKQDATGGRTLALPGSFRRTAGSAPAVAAAANALTLMALTTFNGGSNWWATLTTVAP